MRGRCGRLVCATQPGCFIAVIRVFNPSSNQNQSFALEFGMSQNCNRVIVLKKSNMYILLDMQKGLRHACDKGLPLQRRNNFLMILIYSIVDILQYSSKAGKAWPWRVRRLGGKAPQAYQAPRLDIQPKPALHKLTAASCKGLAPARMQSSSLRTPRPLSARAATQ